MRFVLLTALLGASLAHAAVYNLVSTSTMTTNYGATVYVCTYASAQGQMFSITLAPGQICSPSINR
jgi:hypothetical protein